MLKNVEYIMNWFKILNIFQFFIQAKAGKD